MPAHVAPDTRDDSLHDGPESRGRYEPQLLVALECDRPLGGPARFSLAGADEIVLGRGATREAVRVTSHGHTTLHIRIPAPSMSSSHARLVRSEGRWLFEDTGSKNGCFVNGERVTRTVVGDSDVIEGGRTLFFLRAAMEMRSAPRDLDAAQLLDRPHALRTLLPWLAADLASLEQLAGTRVPIVLLGETGTGKEVVARALHALSARPGPLVAVNCGALPQSLVEAHLFGHVKGAFSGATGDAIGFVRSAHEGTLFLDEVGDLPQVSQAALLRVLQDGEVTPVGTTRATRVDLRVLSATNRPLSGDRMALRADLVARLAGFTLHLAPLRERIEDLGLALAEMLASHAPGGGEGVTLSPDLGRALLRHPWPSNFRELQQALSAALPLSGDGALRPKHFPTLAGGACPSWRPIRTASPAAAAPLTENDEQIRLAVVARLKEHDGNVKAVARSMGKAPMQLYRWMKRFGIDPGGFRQGGGNP